jgi:hypothetical protein
MNVYKKLMEARIKLQSMELKKSGHNKFAGYKYFELGDFLPQIQDIFNKIGLCSFISFTSEYATLTIIDTEDNSQVVFTSPMAEANLKGSHAIQNIGAVETYSRRYLYVSALEIVEHDAIDASEPVAPASAKPIAVDVFSNMSDQGQQEIRSYGVDVIALLSKNDVEGAVEYINMLELGADEKTALWSLLDSKQRSAIKKFTTR